MNKRYWLHRLGIDPKKHKVIFYQNPNRFALSSLTKIDKNPTHSYYLIGYLKKSLRKSKKPIHKIKVCRVLNSETSFLAFLGELPIVFRDSLHVAIANLNIYVNIVDPVYLIVFAVPFSIVYAFIFNKVVS